MIKRILSITISFMMLFAASESAWSADYGRKLSKSEKESLCNQIKASQQSTESGKADGTGIGGGILPDSVFLNIFNTTRKISDASAIVLVLGHALTCNAVHANREEVGIWGVTFFSYPNISVWLCGAIIYFFGFMITLSVTFYLVDIAFKLGFAVIMLPIGIALWPFPPTKNKLVTLISIILKNAAIFAFLAITVSYSIRLLDQATNGLEDLFTRIDNNETDTVAEDFSLSASVFLLVIFALAYGMKLIGATITDYVDAFFQDKAFGSASPIHGSMTQAMDFAKKKALDPVVSYAKDAAVTQAGRLTVGTGKLITGQYNQQLRRAGHYLTNPGELAQKGISGAGRLTSGVLGGAGKAASRVATGTLGTVLMGRQASRALQDKIDQSLDRTRDSFRQSVDEIGAQANQAIKSRTDPLKQSIKQSAVGRGVGTAAHAAQAAYRTTSKGYEKTIEGLNRAKQAVNNVKDKINKPLDRLNANYKKSINRFKDAINKPINNAVNRMTKAIDAGIANEDSDTKGVKAAKAVIRGAMKAPVKILGAAAKAPATVLSVAAKAPVAITTGVLKAPASIVAGVAKTPIKVAEAAVKLTNYKTWTRGAGSVLERVGEKMQDHKSYRDRDAERRAVEDWEAEEKERIEREEQERRDNKTWE